jgi:hypothetical protein
MSSWQVLQRLAKKLTRIGGIFLLSPLGSRVCNIEYRQNIACLRITKIMINNCGNVQPRYRTVCLRCHQRQISIPGGGIKESMSGKIKYYQVAGL